MPVNIISQAPKTRCYKCKKSEFTMVCHHCGRAICSANDSTPIPKGKAIKNTEFSKLDLFEEHIDEKGVHCEDCIHFICSHKRTIVILMNPSYFFIL